MRGGAGGRPTRALVALLALSWPAAATTLGDTTLGKLISGAERIVVGRVVRVHPVPTGKAGAVARLRVAEVEVLESIKGEPRTDRVWYLAERTSGVDMSRAVADEKALLFLADPKGAFGAIDEDVGAALATPLFRKGARATTGGAPLLELCWAGRGRMPVTRIGGVEHVEIDAERVRLPADFESVPVGDPWFRDYVRLAPLAVLVARAKRRLAPWKGTAGTEAALRIVDALDSSTIPDSERAEKAIEAAGESAVPGLLTLLDDPGFPRRDTVAEALLRIGGAGRRAIVDGLGAKDAARRRGAIFAVSWAAAARLDEIPDDEMPRILRAMSDRDPVVRARAAETLGDLASLGALDASVAARLLGPALADRGAGVLPAALRGLVRMQESLGDVGDGMREKLEAALRPLAAHEELAVRRAAWEVLARVARPSTERATLRALDDEDRIVRVSATLALGRTGGAEAIGHAIRILSSSDPWARRAAAMTLGVAGAARAVAPLATALGDEDDLVVELAIDALGEIGPAAAAALPALEGLRASERGAYFEEEIAKAIEKIRR